jgi:hypothetical protein
MNTEQATREQTLAVVDAFFAALESMDIPAFLGSGINEKDMVDYEDQFQMKKRNIQW